MSNLIDQLILLPPQHLEDKEALIRKCFEKAVQGQNLPLTRKGHSYRSSYTATAWSLVFDTLTHLQTELKNHEASSCVQFGPDESSLPMSGLSEN